MSGQTSFDRKARETVEKAEKGDLVAMFAEYVNLPQSWTASTNPVLAAYTRFISECERDGMKFDWSAAREAVAELCSDGKLCTVNQFRAVYFKRAKSSNGATGCEECHQSGIVNVVAGRNHKTGGIFAIDAPRDCMAYVVAIPCRCPKGRIVQESFHMSDWEADKAFSKRRSRAECFRLARQCVAKYHGDRGISEFAAQAIASVFGTTAKA